MATMCDRCINGKWIFNIIVMIIVILNCYQQHVFSDALSYRLGPYEKACFYTRVENSTTPMKLLFYYSVQAQDPSNVQAVEQQRIEVRLTNPQGKILLLNADKITGDHTFTEYITPGEYMFCFSNMMFVTPKIVDFEVNAVEIDSDQAEYQEDYVGGLSHPKLSKFEDSLSRLQNELRTIQSYQRYFRNRDIRNMQTVDATGSLISWFTTFQIFIAAGMSGLQVYMIRKYFSTSSKVRL